MVEFSLDWVSRMPSGNRVTNGTRPLSRLGSLNRRSADAPVSWFPTTHAAPLSVDGRWAHCPGRARILLFGLSSLQNCSQLLASRW